MDKEKCVYTDNRTAFHGKDDLVAKFKANNENVSLPNQFCLGSTYRSILRQY